ncbi:MAG: hypothetical protein ACXWW0_12945 [Bacteroidia bacterium]
MKTLKITLIALFAGSLAFTACQKNQESNKGCFSGGNEEYAEPTYQISDLKEIEEPDITQADEKNEFKLRDEKRHNALRPCEITQVKKRKGDEKERPEIKPKDLPFILKQLELDSTQKHAVRGFLKDYCDCLGENHRKTHSINKEHLRKANQHRQELIEAYKNGRITKAELDEKLRTLRSRIKENMRKDHDKRAHMEMMKKCENGLFRSISTVLDRSQASKFNRWLESRK